MKQERSKHFETKKKKRRKCVVSISDHRNKLLRLSNKDVVISVSANKGLLFSCGSSLCIRSQLTVMILLFGVQILRTKNSTRPAKYQWFEFCVSFSQTGRQPREESLVVSAIEPLAGGRLIHVC